MTDLFVHPGEPTAEENSAVHHIWSQICNLQHEICDLEEDVADRQQHLDVAKRNLERRVKLLDDLQEALRKLRT